MSKKYFWKVWLRPNLLTQDDSSDYIADVSTIGKTLHNADIAAAIKEEGAGLPMETILDVINRADRIRMQRLGEGYSVQTGMARFAPRVQGVWNGSTLAFKEQAHKVTFDMIPTAELRAVSSEVSVDVLGIKGNGALIRQVTDVATGNINSTITPGNTIKVNGAKIKLFGKEDSVGLYFKRVDNGDGVKLTINEMTINNPSELVALVPALASGQYRLEVCTQFSNSAIPLKQARVITMDEPLTVV